MAYAFNDDKSKAEMADIVAEIIGRMYPVGSIYMSVRNVDPGTLFGQLGAQAGCQLELRQATVISIPSKRPADQIRLR